MTTRTEIDSNTLNDLVSNELTGRLLGIDPFTGFNVAQSLRAANPDIEIDGQAVRAAVQAAMNPLPEGWEKGYRRFHGRPAIEYRRAYLSDQVPGLADSDDEDDEDPNVAAINAALAAGDLPADEI